MDRPRPTTPEDAAEQDPIKNEAQRGDRRRKPVLLWGRLSIHSKLLTMLLSVGIVAILVAGAVGYQSGSKALREQAYQHLVTARDARARQVEALFRNIRRSLETYSVGDSTRAAMTEFDAAFDALANVPISATDRQVLRQYYAQTFVPAVREASGSVVTAENVMPNKNQQVYLQAHYIARAPSTKEQRVSIDDAGDGSTWSQVHSKYNEFFRTLMQKRGYHDVMLVDADGNIVYTSDKGIELGANLFGELYNDTLLSQGVRGVLRSNAVNEMKLTDFEEYLPNLDRPAAFGLTPIGIDGKVVGVMVIQLPVDRINAAMTTRENWRGTGLGNTGEVFLVGEDKTMRSTSRLLVQDPEAYRRAANRSGLAPELIDEIVSQRSPILRQPIDSQAVESGLNGETGTTTEQNYLGKTVLTNYAPLDVKGLNWVAVAQMDKSEALAPVRTFVRNLGLAALVLVLLLVLASLILARAFTGPVARLRAGAQCVAGGDLDARVDVRSRDEFGDLAAAFNDMGEGLRGKQDELDEQRKDNERLLTYLMPEPMAERYRDGEQDIVAEHPDVCVIVASLTGFDEFTAGERISRLNELANTIESAAETAGVELVHTQRSSYVASCGLVVPRVDKTLRVIDFAKDLDDAIARFNAQHGASLALRAGIATGQVAGGLVGGRAAYDIWGEGVDLARKVQYAAEEPGIYLTEPVYESVRDSYEFAQLPQPGSDEDRGSVWMLAPGDRQ